MAFLAAVVLVNLIAVWLAWKDRSWGALGIALLYGPIANGAMELRGSCAPTCNDPVRIAPTE